MTHYQALEILPTAEAATIRAAYRRLVLLTHPDRTPDPAAHARYLAVNAAYEVLSDPARRQAYDLLSAGASSPPAPATNPAWGPGQAREQAHRRPPGPIPARTAEEIRLGPHAQIYLKYSTLARRLNYAFVAFVFLLVADYLCAIRYPAEPIIGREYRITHNRRGQALESYYLFATPHAKFRSNKFYEFGQMMTLRRSPVFRQVLDYAAASDLPTAAATDDDDGNETLYSASALALIPVVLLLTATVGAWPGPLSRRAVECATMASLLAIIVLWLLSRN